MWRLSPPCSTAFSITAMCSNAAREVGAPRWRPQPRTMRRKRGAMVGSGRLWKCRVHGKRGKAKAAFPLFPRPLGNLAKGARFPHSHSPASPRMEKCKTTIRFSTFPRGSRDDSYGLSVLGTKRQKQRTSARSAGLCSLLRITLYWKCDSNSKKLLPRWSPTRYNKLSPGRGPLAGFEVTLYGRF